MRRWIHACAGAAAALALSALAADAGSKLQIESKGGCNFAKFTGDAPGAETKTGLAGGIGIGIPVNAWLSIQPELLYAMKGTSFGSLTDPVIDGTTFAGTYEVLFAVDYIELPLLMRSRFGEGGMVRPVFLAGPVLGWKVLEKFRLNGADDNDLEAENDAGRALDFGASAGFALELGPAPACFVLEGRYTQSLMNVQKPEYEGSIKNSDVRVNLGWRSNWPSWGIQDN